MSQQVRQQDSLLHQPLVKQQLQQRRRGILQTALTQLLRDWQTLLLS
jgi:hypothetical protein